MDILKAQFDGSTLWHAGFRMNISFICEFFPFEEAKI
jgi:hypothetical protein